MAFIWESTKCDVVQISVIVVVGTYCIYKGTYGNCPLDFTGGSVTWEDEDDHNRNCHQGTLPLGSYYINQTTIFFCCRSDGPKAISINLPTTSPFYLLAHKYKSCQQVRLAVATSEWIYYDTEDDNGKRYNSIKPPAPYISEKKSGYKVYYCYYRSKFFIQISCFKLAKWFVLGRTWFPFPIYSDVHTGAAYQCLNQNSIG